MKSFTMEYWIDDGWYVGKLKEVPGVFSQGETLEELELNIKDAFYLMMQDENEILLDKEISKKQIEVEV